MSFLRYDSTGLTDDAIGDDLGISPDDRENLQTRLASGLESILHRHREDELGFLDCPLFDTTAIEVWATETREEKWTDQVVIGIGGSSLGTRAILSAASDAELGGLRTHFAENIDPRTVSRLFGSLRLETTLFVVVTKSGTTLETMGQFWIAYEK
ncbi:MAG: hypothetical protein ACNA8W_14190, partial [Bradymonadaceae bacterium]